MLLCKLKSCVRAMIFINDIRFNVCNLKFCTNFFSNNSRATIYKSLRCTNDRAATVRRTLAACSLYAAHAGRCPIG